MKDHDNEYQFRKEQEAEARLTRTAREMMPRQAAVLFRGKIFVGVRHSNALHDAVASVSAGDKREMHRICHAIDEGDEPVEFGFANFDGSDWETAEMQEARKRVALGY